MIFAHRSYTSISSPLAGGHGHQASDTIKVAVEPPPPAEGEIPDLEEHPRAQHYEDQPALLPSGNWRIVCTPDCEAHILKAVQFTGVSEKAIPLTGDEEKEATRESQRSQVEVAQLARALGQVLRGADANAA